MGSMDQICRVCLSLRRKSEKAAFINSMSNKNLYLIQINCLLSPENNLGWHEVVQYSPSALQCLVNIARSGAPEHALSGEQIAISCDKQKVFDKPKDESIPWSTFDDKHKDNCKSESMYLKRFVYDCSYLSPYVGNVYKRERAADGWYRWVGPDPVLIVRVPLAPTESDHWLFTVTFHAFLNDDHAKNIIFKVNEKSNSLKWLRGSTYQSRITSANLYGTADSGKLAIPTLSIAIPEARQPSERDQRILAFAISELSLAPA